MTRITMIVVQEYDEYDTTPDCIIEDTKMFLETSLKELGLDEKIISVTQVSNCCNLPIENGLCSNCNSAQNLSY